MKLSICIPTYNRANTIIEAVESVLRQNINNSEVEIVVSDNGSKDETKKLLESYVNKGLIRYFEFTENMGADVNFLKVIEVARGEYCWFLGSDDALPEYSVQFMLSQIDIARSNIFFINKRARYTRDLCKFLKYESFIDPLVSRSINSSEDLYKYILNSKGIAGIFTYISSLVIHKKTWEEASIDISFLGSNYIHVHKIFLMLDNASLLTILDYPLVNERGDNDSFLSSGFLNRRLIDYKLYDIAKASFKVKKKAPSLVLDCLARFFLTPKVALGDRLRVYRSSGLDNVKVLDFHRNKLFKNNFLYYFISSFYTNVPISVLIALYKIIK